MNLFKYNDFINKPINENLDKSRKFLKDRELIKLAARQLNLINKDLEYDLKSGDKKVLSLSDFNEEDQAKIRTKIREINLDQDQLRKLEQDADFIKLKDLLKDNLGYLYNFVYMFFVEKTPFDEIEQMYRKVIDYKQILDKMVEYPDVAKKFDANFINPNIPNEKEHRTNSEILAEGLDKLDSYKKVKKILDTLTTKLKKSYKDTSDVLKEELEQVAKLFDELPNDKVEGEDTTVKERIWKNFFGEMKEDTDELLPNGSKNPNFGKMVYKSRLKRFEETSNPIRELIKAAKAHLEGSSKDGYTERVEKISKCNDLFGVNGCDIVFDQGGIMIVTIKSYAANKLLNSHCNHCIVNWESYWYTYLSDYNIQYYIYNFNLSSLDEYSTIGVTIKPDRTSPAGACQTIRNTSIGNNFKKILKGWEKEYNIEDDIFQQLEPLSSEEVEKRKKAKEAERKIVEKGISIDQIKEYVTVYGANINKDDSRALINAVSEDDYEKVKYILSLGADPNLAKGTNSALSKATNLDMIKLLISSGADMIGEVFNNIAHDSKAVEYCLKAGMDPNFTKSMPLRTVAKGTYKVGNIGEGFFDSFVVLIKNGAKMYDERGKNMILRWVADKCRMDMLKYLETEGYKFPVKEWKEALEWMEHNPNSEEVNRETVDYIKNKIEELEKGGS